jgi:hypothetical protein
MNCLNTEIRVAFCVGAFVLSTLSSGAQQATTLPSAPSPQPGAAAPLHYVPPSQRQRFITYVRHTFGVRSVIEAGIRGGIEQARDNPSQWPEGAEGYGERVASSMGQIVVRGTTEYLIADTFREDLRFVRCPGPCSQSALRRALHDTFMARKRDDGHFSFSVARLTGPIAAGAVATSTWYPAGYGAGATVKEIGLNYGFSFLRNYIWELTH